jgi:hypothetical protein
MGSITMPWLILISFVILLSVILTNKSLKIFLYKVFCSMTAMASEYNNAYIGLLGILILLTIIITIINHLFRCG